AEPLPLADGEAMHAAVRAEFTTTLVDDRPAAFDRRILARDERRIVAVGDEADLLAVGLVGDDQSEPPRLLAHIRLHQRADGEYRPRELILREREQEVRLILLDIRAALEQPSAVGILLDTRVVTGGDLFGAETARAFEKR